MKRAQTMYFALIATSLLLSVPLTDAIYNSAPGLHLLHFLLASPWYLLTGIVSTTDHPAHPILWRVASVPFFAIYFAGIYFPTFSLNRKHSYTIVLAQPFLLFLHFLIFIAWGMSGKSG